MNGVIILWASHDYKAMPLGADFNMHTNGNMEEKKLTLRDFYLAKGSL